MHRLTVVVVALASMTIAASASAAPPLNTGNPPGIQSSPTPTVPQLLQELPAVWFGQVTSVSVQWLDCDAGGQACAPIPGATGQTYKLAPSDVGHTVRVQEIASSADGASAPAVSPPTAVVMPAPIPPPVNTTRPVISGQDAVGAVLTETPGTWSGTMPISFSYQWYLCKVVHVAGKPGKPGYSTVLPCQPIRGATKPTYTVTTADKPGNLYATVTASNAGGSMLANPATAAIVPPTSYLGLGPGGADRLWALPRNVPPVPSILAHGGVTGSYRAPRAGLLDITWTAVVDGKGLLVAQAHARFRHGGWYKVKTRLTKRGAAALKRNYLLGVFIIGAWTPTTGPLAGQGPSSQAESLAPIVF